MNSWQTVFHVSDLRYVCVSASGAHFLLFSDFYWSLFSSISPLVCKTIDVWVSDACTGDIHTSLHKRMDIYLVLCFCVCGCVLPFYMQRGISAFCCLFYLCECTSCLLASSLYVLRCVSLCESMCAFYT